MKTPGKTTPRMRERVVELSTPDASGWAPGNREIAEIMTAEGLGLSHAAVGAIRRDAGLSQPKVGGRRKGLPSRAARAAALKAAASDDDDEPAQPPSAPPGGGDGDDPDDELDGERAALDALLDRRPEALPRLPADASLAAKAVWWDLVQVRAEVAAMRSKVRAGTMPFPQWIAGLKQATALAEALSGLLPPEPPDAAKDPQNIQARAMLHGHVLQSVEAAKARCGRLCPRCHEEVVLRDGRAA